MIDFERIKEIIEERKKAHINDPDIEKKYWIPLLNALGDDENEIIEYLNELDDDTVSWFSEIYEEVVSKFPSKEMEEIFHKINRINSTVWKCLNLNIRRHLFKIYW